MWVKCAFEDYLSCLYTSRVTCPIYILEEFYTFIKLDVLEEKAILPICQQNNLSYKHTNRICKSSCVISNPHYPILNAIKISVQFKRCSDFTKQNIVKTYMYFEKKPHVVKCFQNKFSKCGILRPNLRILIFLCVCNYFIIETFN